LNSLFKGVSSQSCPFGKLCPLIQLPRRYGSLLFPCLSKSSEAVLFLFFWTPSPISLLVESVSAQFAGRLRPPGRTRSHLSTLVSAALLGRGTHSTVFGGSFVLPPSLVNFLRRHFCRLFPALEEIRPVFASPWNCQLYFFLYRPLPGTIRILAPVSLLGIFQRGSPSCDIGSLVSPFFWVLEDLQA